ncbi:hypothetical protein SAMD00019534_060860 [Acytostelium subglobosum LB1]|uniref:hypothetical protein n=1 Tax=Acytostelium subglobosum LB1 TaxID=1410327 RepID=UPI000644AC57|nr:hypothetical protein SAMD00019534_060860 [Acytostelium subglobosum LB1]GAM22911.1 hypothetical protein SAMD00019534_060860 [Acytostelium subglobosum LB1]|eukprot:XP_012754138.1 hypothetical protein SAMD00019534_060860 [Acytostelium subglobosum LB1]
MSQPTNDKVNNITSRLYTLAKVDAQPTLSITVLVQDLLFPDSNNSTIMITTDVVMNVSIQGWTYQSNMNTLRVVLFKNASTTTVKNGPHCGRVFLFGWDSIDNNMQYFRDTDYDQLFATFPTFGLSNGLPTFTRNELISSSTNQSLFGINLPQCQQCSVSPSFSVLDSPDSSNNRLQYGCEGDSKKGDNYVGVSGIIAIAVVCSVVLLAIIITIIVLVVRRVRRSRREQASNKMGAL